MIINHNISALNTYNQLSKNEKAEQSSLQKLSSGLRINSAADDAAGLAISQKMQAQINGLDQASRNAQDGISLVQTAEGSMNEVQSIMQRMNELANQASNDTNDGNSGTDRNALNQEFSSLRDEINRIADQSQFNGKNILDGTYDFQTSADSAADGITYTTTGTGGANAISAGATADGATIVTSAGLSTGTYTLKYDGTAKTYSLTDSTGTVVAKDVTDVDNSTGAVTFDLKGTSGQEFKFTTVGDSTDSSFHAGSLDGQSVTVTNNAVVDNANIDSSSIIGSNVEDGTWTIANGSGANTGKYVATNGSHTMVSDTDVAGAGTITFNGTAGEKLTVNKKAGYSVGSLNNDKLIIGGNSLTLQVGANEGDTISMSITNMTTNQTNSATAMKALNSCDISTQTGASSAITTVQNAVDYVSTSRASLGAYQNRLDHTINNLTTESQNLTSASSSITDVDMASEMMNYSKNSILNQAAQAMLAQANQLGSGVLSLLKG